MLETATILIHGQNAQLEELIVCSSKTKASVPPTELISEIRIGSKFRTSCRNHESFLWYVRALARAGVVLTPRQIFHAGSNFLCGVSVCLDIAILGARMAWERLESICQEPRAEGQGHCAFSTTSMAHHAMLSSVALLFLSKLQTAISRDLQS